MDGHDPRSVSEKAVALLESNSAQYQRIYILDGIEPVPTKITDEIYLIPLVDLADRDIHRELNSQKSYKFHVNPLSPALVSSYTMSPAIVEKSDYRTTGMEYRHRQIQDIVLALTLVGPCAPSLHFLFDRIVSFPMNLQRGIGSSLVEFITSYTIQKGKYDAELAIYIVDRFLTLPERSKKRLRIALQRLNSSFRRQELADRAIEVGVALESVLARDRNAWDPISLLIRLRGSWLLGSNAETRKEISDVLNKIYSH